MDFLLRNNFIKQFLKVYSRHSFEKVIESTLVLGIHQSLKKRISKYEQLRKYASIVLPPLFTLDYVQDQYLTHDSVPPPKTVTEQPPVDLQSEIQLIKQKLE